MEALDEKAYKNYKRRIAQAVAKVDNSPPRFNMGNYYKARNLTIDANRVREIDRENMVLLRRMNLITRLGGSVDCWMPNVKYQSNLNDPEIENRIIRRSNKVLLRRIQQSVSNYPAAELIKSWKDMKMKVTRSARQIFHLPKILYIQSIP